jgi:hypothetical protein
MIFTRLLVRNSAVQLKLRFFDTLVDLKVVPTATAWSSMEQCRVSISAVKSLWAVPYIAIMVFEVGSSHPLSSLSDMADTRQLY